MLSRFMSRNPDTLSFGEQILSALLGASLATIAASAITSVIVIGIFAML